MKHVLRVLALISLLSLAATAAETGTGASFKGPVGLQLYSLRGIATQNPPKALTQTKDLGLKPVETAGTYNLPPEKFKARLAEHGLKTISGHFPCDRWKSEPEKVLAEAQAIGLQYAGCAWITHQAPFSEVAARDAIAVFNKAGELGALELSTRSSCITLPRRCTPSCSPWRSDIRDSD